MDINIEEIFKMTVFDYKDLEQIDVFKELELYEVIFEEEAKKEKQISHEHPEYKIEKLGRNMRACKHTATNHQTEKNFKLRRRSVDVNEVKVQSPRESVKSTKSTVNVYASDLDKLIKENKDSYFSKLLMQDSHLEKIQTNNFVK